MMDSNLLSRLSETTEEEKALLNGRGMDRSLYYSSEQSQEIDVSRVLDNGKNIDIRLHTRFVHFPEHSHNYVELVYMAKGTTTHIIDGETIVLHEGDLLFLNQHAKQEILSAGENDIAVNLMVRPQFFDTSFRMMGEQDNDLRRFLVSCLTQKRLGCNYIYFEAHGIVPVQNLVENLIWNLHTHEPNSRNINETTMGLLLLSMVNHSHRIMISDRSCHAQLAVRLLSYIESHYAHASLSAFASGNGTDIYSVSRVLRRQTGKTFRELLEHRRMEQSLFMLRNTTLSIEEIAHSVGYDNLSFFYRLFRRNFLCTPGEYRSGRGSSLRREEAPSLF